MLKVKNLTKRFGGLVAVDDVSFEVDEGEIIGIIGPNGAGKTTVFSLITGYLKPDTGSVLLQNEDITGLKPHQVARRGLTRTFQIPRPFPNFTVFKNVYAACIAVEKDLDSPKQETMRILEVTGLSKQEERVAGSLSTGELKLLEVARMLATEAKVLLLDEPFAGAGAEEMTRLVSLIKELHEQGKTLVIIEHILKQLMRIVETVIVLHRGEKIAEGTPMEIAESKKVIEAYLGDVKIA